MILKQKTKMKKIKKMKKILKQKKKKINKIIMKKKMIKNNKKKNLKEDQQEEVEELKLKQLTQNLMMMIQKKNQNLKKLSKNQLVNNFLYIRMGFFWIKNYNFLNIHSKMNMVGGCGICELWNVGGEGGGII